MSTCPHLISRVPRAALLALILATALPRAAATEPVSRGDSRRADTRESESARRWAIRTHMYLAEEMLRDLLPDGRITIYRTNYHAATVGEKLGDYDVDPLVLAAIRGYPAQFRAGVMAGDAYPDIVTGQSVVHPHKAIKWHPFGLGGHDAWLRHLWEMSREAATPPPARAFVAGVLLHSAGDMFGHTFVNHFTGRPFALPPESMHNAKNHLLIDMYVGVRTPDVLVDTRGTLKPINASDVSIAGAEDFIYRAMINAVPGSRLETHLMPAESATMSIPRIFSDIRHRLEQDIAWYSNQLLTYDRAIKAKYDSALALGCARADLMTACRPEAWRFKVDAASIEALRTGHVAAQSPIRDYRLQWRNEIERGLRKLPTYSQRIVLALLYPIAQPHGLGAAKAIAEEYVRLHVLAMSGAPPEVGQALQIVDQTIREITDAIVPPEVERVIAEITRAPVDFMLMATVGMTAAQAEQYVSAPQTHFEREMRFNPGDGGVAITLAGMNRQLMLADAGFTTGADPNKPAEYMDYRKVPPLYNSVVLSQLSLLSQVSLNQLLGQLGFPPQASPHFHVMLGFMPSIDGDNQWHGDTISTDSLPGATPPMLSLAYDCNAYTQIFMKQTGERGMYSCTNWAPPQVAQAGVPQSPTRVAVPPAHRVVAAQLGDVTAVHRLASAGQPAARSIAPRAPVHPADAGFRLTMPLIERWSRAAGNLVRSPLAAELSRPRGVQLTPAVDALAATLGRAPRATAAVADAGFSMRDFALAHLTLARAVAAQHDPARAAGVSTENVRFVAGERTRVERLARDAGIAWGQGTTVP